MTFNNGILFYGLDRDGDNFLHLLDQRITDKIKSVKEQAESPFNYDTKHDAWFIDANLLSKGQAGGYNSIEQAAISLCIIRSGKTIDYQTLYKMSKFILAGIETL